MRTTAIAIALAMAIVPMAAKATDGFPCEDTNILVATETANMKLFTYIRAELSHGAPASPKLLRVLDEAIANDEKICRSHGRDWFPWLSSEQDKM